jgi:hypothetical protein
VKTTTYSHAAPYIRLQLMHAVYAAYSARTQRDRNESFARAAAYRLALSIMANSLDQTPVPGIADVDSLPPSALGNTREWLGKDADLILGTEEGG